jgi:hypothetical protein
VIVDIPNQNKIGVKHTTSVGVWSSLLELETGNSTKGMEAELPELTKFTAMGGEIVDVIVMSIMLQVG